MGLAPFGRLLEFLQFLAEIGGAACPSTLVFAPPEDPRFLPCENPRLLRLTLAWGIILAILNPSLTMALLIWVAAVFAVTRPGGPDSIPVELA